MKKIVLRNGRTMRCPTFLLCIAAVLLAVGVLLKRGTVRQIRVLLYPLARPRQARVQSLLRGQINVKVPLA